MLDNSSKRLINLAQRLYLVELRTRVCAVKCPACGASPYTYCIGAHGHRTKGWHEDRSRAAAREGYIDGLHRGERLEVMAKLKKENRTFGSLMDNAEKQYELNNAVSDWVEWIQQMNDGKIDYLAPQVKRMYDAAITLFEKQGIKVKPRKRAKK